MDPSDIPPQLVIPAIAVAPARYVRIPLFCTLTGWSEKAVRRKREAGEWREGQVFVTKGGTVLVDMEGYYRWVEEDRARA